MRAMVKALVLGASGFIGSNLAAVLEHKGHNVSRPYREPGFLCLDLKNENNILDYLNYKQPDIIFNCAAHTGNVHYVMAHAAAVMHDNCLMAENLYKAVSLVCPKAHIVNPLSNCSYPGAANIQHEKSWLSGEPHHSVFAYANSKRFIYSLSKCYNLQHKIRTSNFLVPNAFGPGDHLDVNRTHALSGMIVRMIKAKRENEQIFEVWGSGNPIREWGYVDDVVEILSRAIDLKEDLIYPVNIAQNHGVSIRESAEAIKKAVGYEGDLWFNTEYEDGAPTKVLDDKKFREMFPKYRFIDHAEAIKRTVKYYEQAMQ